MKTVSIIRNRGQLTIPDSIRKSINWIGPLSPITISLVKPDEIVIRPHQHQVDVDWEKLWKQIKRVRSFKGDVNLSQFIMEDREALR